MNFVLNGKQKLLEITSNKRQQKEVAPTFGRYDPDILDIEERVFEPYEGG
jgi:hypothetical protein